MNTFEEKVLSNDYSNVFQITILLKNIVYNQITEVYNQLCRTELYWIIYSQLCNTELYTA
jgi:hypothetical protein